MTINLGVPQPESLLKPRITVIGVGGAGGNAVNNMIQSRLEGVEFLVANTDAQSLGQTLAERKIQLGTALTHGLGAGSRPDVGRAAAEEELDEIMTHLQGCHMVFITAGMGGGTGTGAAPVIARAAREQGILTVGVVTKPFQFEGSNRMRIAEAGIEEMQHYVDTLIVIPNQNLFRVANEQTTFADAFSMADQVLHSGVRGVTDLMVVPGLINLDFADIRTVMSEMGKAMMGTGEAEGATRAKDAAEAAISNPLLDDVSMKGARGVLINITGGTDLTLYEVDEAANRIGDEVDPEANIIFGSTMDPELEGKLRVSVVATGIDADTAVQPRPVFTVVPRPEPKPVVQEQPEPTPQPVPEPAAVAEQQPKAAEPTLLDVAEAKPAEPADAEADAPDIPAPPAAAEPAVKQAAGPVPPVPAAAVVAPKPAATQPAGPARLTDAFVPPRAADPVHGREEPRPDPFRAADMTNGPGPQEDRNRMSKLFARVTGVGRPVREVTAEPSAPPPAASVEAEKPAPRQTRLDGVDPSDRLPASSQAEDDLLDIPAFLRRQAN